MSYSTLEEVLADLEEGVLVRGMIPTALMDFANESNIEAVIAGLPFAYRSYFLDWAKRIVSASPDQIITVAGLSNMREMHPEELRHPQEEAFMQALRGWFEKHS